MTWYVASLLFEATHSQPSVQEGVWEESLVLLEAESPTMAQEMAEKIGLEREVAYQGQGADQVLCAFRKVERVFDVPEATLQSGVEVFSRFLKDSEARCLLTKFSQ